MSLLGDVVGGIGANHAAGNIATGYQNAENGITGTITEGLNRSNAALANVNAATQTGENAITGAQSNFQPYIGAGNTGVTALENYATSPNSQFSFNPSQYFNSPAYQFQLKEGQNAINNSASAMGLGSSGNTLRDLSGFGEGLAANYYNQAFNQAESTFNTNQNATLANLSTLINSGEFGTAGNQNAANYGAQFGLQGAGLGLSGTENENAFQLQGSKIAGDYAVGLGNALADKTMAGYNAWGNVGSDLIGLASPYVGSIPTGSGSATTLSGIFG